MKAAVKSKPVLKVREMTFIAMMGALSGVIMLFRFPLPFLPPFMSFDLSPIVEMIGGFMFGPVAAVLIIIVKILVNLVIQGSYSVGTGELQNLILGCAYVMPAIFVYRKKTRKNVKFLLFTKFLDCRFIEIISMTIDYNYHRKIFHLYF